MKSQRPWPFTHEHQNLISSAKMDDQKTLCVWTQLSNAWSYKSKNRLLNAHTALRTIAQCKHNCRQKVQYPFHWQNNAANLHSRYCEVPQGLKELLYDESIYYSLPTNRIKIPLVHGHTHTSDRWWWGLMQRKLLWTQILKLKSASFSDTCSIKYDEWWHLSRWILPIHPWMTYQQ